MRELHLTLLGGFRASLDGTALTVSTRKAQALVAYLVVPPDQAHPRDKLAALLWGDLREDRARANLRQTLFVLRKTLGRADPNVLSYEGDGIILRKELVDSDVSSFEGCVAEGTPHALATATTLYRGDLLAGLAVAEPLFEDWLLAERERLQELALEALGKLLAHQRATGALEAAVQTARRILATDPLLEVVHRALMRLYADLGRRGDALRQYQECVGVLQRELGVEPEPETRALYQEILRERARARAPEAEPVWEAEVAENAVSRCVDVRPERAMSIERETELALERILSSSAFRSARRLCRFLGHIIRETLAGNGNGLTEYSIASAVFDRGVRFDPRSDSIVRVEARTLREKLEGYYRAEGATDPVVIRLSKGSYRPLLEPHHAPQGTSQMRVLVTPRRKDAPDHQPRKRVGENVIATQTRV